MRPSRVIICMAVLLWVGLAVLTGGAVRERAVQAQSDYDCATATGIPQVECEALVAFYHATGGENWYDNTGWLQTTTPCG